MHLTILHLPGYEHGLFLHIFTLSLISLINILHFSVYKFFTFKIVKLFLNIFEVILNTLFS